MLQPKSFETSRGFDEKVTERTHDFGQLGCVRIDQNINRTVHGLRPRTKKVVSLALEGQWRHLPTRQIYGRRINNTFYLSLLSYFLGCFGVR